jgi:hypothetical protein
MSTTSTQSGLYRIQNANSMERISDSPKAVFNKIWIYPSQGVAKKLTGSVQEGQLILNTGTVYVGEVTESDKATPDALATGDLPLKIELPVGAHKLLRDVLIQGANVGDGVWFKYWP